MNSFADVPAMIAACGASRGKVYLVGAGPGDPELLTLRAARLLAQAQAVVYDNLVGPEVLALIHPAAQRIYVGKERSRHTMAQEDINALLVRLAGEGLSVVRLKGGDPFIFGRGGEELQVLAAHGVPFEVVPGITAACGAASYAGIPLTHRDHAQSCLFVTGHVKEGAGEMDWAALARPNQTLAIYMGLSMLPSICERLVESGVSPGMPAAAIEQGTLPGQRVIAATLSTLAAEVAAAGLRSPCLTVVGEVVRLREQLAWFDAPALLPHESRVAFTTGA
jgi:uroporphyrin-III C-methyltransferase/precorrin-2 dehydrogenase/sirohydrochlorin ferrochelatase